MTDKRRRLQQQLKQQYATTTHRERRHSTVARHLRHERHSHRKNNKSAWQDVLADLDTQRKREPLIESGGQTDPGHSISNSATNAKVAIAGSRRTISWPPFSAMRPPSRRATPVATWAPTRCHTITPLCRNQRFLTLECQRGTVQLQRRRLHQPAQESQGAGWMAA